MMGAIKKIGNSLWVLLPAAIAKKAGLHDGTKVSVSINENGEIHVRKKVSAIEALAISASVSYKSPPCADDIKRMIISCSVDDAYISHMSHILNEAPSALWIDVARELDDPGVIGNVAKLREAINAA